MQAPGGTTGLIVQSQKVVGSGRSQQVVTEYFVDIPLLRELRELERQAAQESGQWTLRTEVSSDTPPPAQAISQSTTNIVNITSLSTEELQLLRRALQQAPPPAELPPPRAAPSSAP